MPMMDLNGFNKNIRLSPDEEAIFDQARGVYQIWKNGILKKTIPLDSNQYCNTETEYDWKTCDASAKWKEPAKPLNKEQVIAKYKKLGYKKDYNFIGYSKYSFRLIKEDWIKDEYKTFEYKTNNVSVDAGWFEKGRGNVYEC